MRRILVCAVALAFASAASAQPALRGFDDYHFGMTPDEARVVDSSLQTDEGSSAELAILRSRNAVAFGLVTIAPRLQFRRDRLTRIVFDVAEPLASAEQCTLVYGHVLQALEHRFGAFNGDPAPDEYGALASVRTTAGGSIVRTYHQDAEQLTHANRASGGWIEIIAHIANYPGIPPGTVLCEITIDMRPEAPLADPQLTPPTPQQLAAAQILENVPWNAQPGSDEFETTLPQYFPRGHVEINVQLDCLIIADGRLNCAIAQEQPAGMMYGEFARRIARYYETRTTVEGRSVIGRRVRLPITLSLSGPDDGMPSVAGVPAPPADVAALRELATHAPGPEALAAAPLLSQPPWRERPEAETYLRYYPPEALEAGIAGRATLECLIAADGQLQCAVTAEEPSDRGFGLAALGIAQSYRVAPEAQGQPTAGKRVRLTIVFNLG